MKTVKLSDAIAASFAKVHMDIKEHGHTHYWLKGGRGSTKSSFVSVEIPLLLIQNPDCHAVVLRKVAKTLRNSVFNQIQWGIDQLGLTDKFQSKVSPLEIVYKKTGQKILFFGVDDRTKIKSIKLPFGYPGIVWYEELDQFDGMEEIRNLNQSLMRGGENYWCFYSFNPPKSRDSWVNAEQINEDPDRMIFHSTYLSVPKNWLGDQFFLEADKLKQRREDLYKHEYLGEVTGSGGNVFENVQDREITDAEIASFDRIKHGLDFGFAVDPLAFVCMQYDKKYEMLYFFDEVYEQKLSNRQAYMRIRNKAERRRIGADSAEPKSIAELQDFGLNIHGVKKGPDSVEYGIRWLQSLTRIWIDKRRCPNTYKEFVRYEYQRNKNGEFISAYPDRDNHSIDAARYGCRDEMQFGGKALPKSAFGF